MNITELQQQADNLIKMVRAATEEASEIETKRKNLESTQLVNSERERDLSNRETTLMQKDKDLAEEKQYIEQKTEDNNLILNRILREKESLQGLKQEELQLEKEKAEFEVEKRSFALLKQEKEQFLKDKETFEEEKRLLGQEKIALAEAQELMERKEANLRQQQEKWDKFDRMTQPLK